MAFLIFSLDSEIVCFSYLHAKKIIHRDLKSNSILYCCNAVSVMISALIIIVVEITGWCIVSG